MKRKLVFLLVFTIFLPAFALADDARLLDYNGKVEVRPGREGKWTPAKRDMRVIEGGAVRTSAGAVAVVILPNKTKIWMKGSSNLEIEQRQTLASRIALVFGSIKLRVPHLLRKERFEVRTPTAVCAVRGTEFTVNSDESGRMTINVLYGEVKLNFVVPPEKGAAELYIPQGRTMHLEEKGQAGKVDLLTAGEERASLEDWDPWLKPEERQQGLKDKEDDRERLHRFAAVTDSTEDSIKGFLNTVKESDLEAGRTLNDVHGNVVRVDQRMVRPYSDEIQFYNIVKRANYADYAKPAGGFAYNGGARTNRLDLMQITMNFNKDLPQRIEEWPGFFSGNDVKAEWGSFVSANRTDSHEIFVIAEGYRYDAGRDELINNTNVVGIGPNAYSAGGADRDVLLSGMLQDDGNSTAAEKLNFLSRLNVSDAGASNGTMTYNKGGTDYNYAVATPGSVLWARLYDTSPGGPDSGLGLPANFHPYYERTGDPSLWQFSADAYLIGGKSANGNLWYTQESYVIGNAGAIKRVGDFTSSSSDPFSILKESAGEVIMSVKAAAAGAAGTPGNWVCNDTAYGGIGATDRFLGASTWGSGTNIDVVFIPDLAVAAIQRMLPAITSLNE